MAGAPQRASTTIPVWVDGVGLIAPGLPDWETGARVLCVPEAYRSAPSILPVPRLLPPAESRRASRAVRLCLALGLEASALAGVAPAALASVFCSSNPDGHIIHAILEGLASNERSISPTRFHNSVHNAAAGYWSIAVRSQRPYQVLGAYDATFSAALIEAAAQVAAEQEPVLMIAFDSEYPEPLRACRRIPDAGGIALVLGPRQTGRSLGRLQIGLGPGPGTLGSALPGAQAVEGSAAIADLGAAIPALAGLPLLAALAGRVAMSLAFAYADRLFVEVQVQPC